MAKIRLRRRRSRKGGKVIKAKPGGDLEPSAQRTQPRERLKVELVLVSSLRLHPRNPNLHAEESVASIARSIAKFGQRSPLVVNAAGDVLKGNGTLRAVQRLGWGQVQAIRCTRLTEEEELAYLLADNRTGDESEWDYDGVRALLMDLQTKGFDLKATGFRDFERCVLLHDQFQPDQIADLERELEQVENDMQTNLATMTLRLNGPIYGLVLLVVQDMVAKGELPPVQKKDGSTVILGSAEEKARWDGQEELLRVNTRLGAAIRAACDVYWGEIERSEFGQAQEVAARAVAAACKAYLERKRQKKQAQLARRKRRLEGTRRRPQRRTAPLKKQRRT